MKTYCVYIMARHKRGTIYIGVTSNIQKRAREHRNHVADGFTKRFGLKRLVHIEQCSDVMSAIAREKKLKKWKRDYKIELIEATNPEWDDLYDGMFV